MLIVRVLCLKLLKLYGTVIIQINWLLDSFSSGKAKMIIRSDEQTCNLSK